MRRNVPMWVCRFTGAKFFEREEFREHLLDLRAKRHYDARVKRLDKEAEQFAASCEALADLQDWLAGGHIMKYLYLLDPKANGSVSNFVFSGISVGNCSNSHSAPLGKETNWGGYKENVPRHYPGISCRISFNHEIKTKICGWHITDIIKRFGIHTGTGGGGGKGNYSYDCIIWAEHFPRLYRNLWARFVANEIGLCDGEAVQIEA